MRRREFVTLVGGAAAWPFSARAQLVGKRWRVGQVLGGSPETIGHLPRALEQRLRTLGYRLDDDLILITRFAVPQLNAMEDAIRSLISDIDLLVVWGTIGGVAARNAAGSLPVVFLSVGAPVDIGLVKSLSHPGSNMTGVTFEAATETYGKRLQILKEIVPSLKRVAVLAAEGDANVPFAMESLEKAALTLSIALTTFGFRAGDDLEETFDEIQRSHAEGLIVIAGVLTYQRGKQIADLTLSHRLPSGHAFRETVVAGGLVSLGPDLPAMAGQGASYIDKIIRGTIPADLPVQQPTQCMLHINLRTARALALAIPLALLARADEVIE